jgi:hypothetical protein
MAKQFKMELRYKPHSPRVGLCQEMKLLNLGVMPSQP